MAPRLISLEEVAKHQTAGDAWLVLNGDVWDVTGFAEGHPGGPDVVEEHFGKDASNVYNDIHGPKLALSYFGEKKLMGKLSPSESKSRPPLSSGKTLANPKLAREPPPLDTLINLQDFEEAAKASISERAWAYVSGASDDCHTLESNKDLFKDIYLRPRVLRAVGKVDTSTVIMGEKFALPVFNAPAAQSMLFHPEAEVALAKGLSASGSTIVIPTLASYAQEEIIDGLPANHPFFCQLYVHSHSDVSEKLIDGLRRSQPKAIMITADLPVMSKREGNMRYRMRIAREDPKKTKSTQNQARAAEEAVDPNVTWETIRDIQEKTGIPVFVKGIQCVEDALMALECGCAGIYISNHGGRAADTAQPSILTLAEINLRNPEVIEKMDVIVDGGIRRGTDVLKAMCLGARGVCLGRPFFYSLVYGEEGVRHLLEILRNELEIAMQLCGITRLDQAHPGLLNTKYLLNRVDGGDWPKRAYKL